MPRRHALPGAPALRPAKPRHVLGHRLARQILDAHGAASLDAALGQRAVDGAQGGGQAALELGADVDALRAGLGDEGREVVVEELPVMRWFCWGFGVFLGEGGESST